MGEFFSKCSQLSAYFAISTITVHFSNAKKHINIHLHTKQILCVLFVHECVYSAYLCRCISWQECLVCTCSNSQRKKYINIHYIQCKFCLCCLCMDIILPTYADVYLDKSAGSVPVHFSNAKSTSTYNYVQCKFCLVLHASVWMCILQPTYAVVYLDKRAWSVPVHFSNAKSTSIYSYIKC
jgi:hypothetical protein